MRGAGEVQKKNSRTPINPKKYSCKDLKKIHTRNLITKKNSCGSKIPLPPHNFSNGPSLSRFNWYFYYEGEGGGGEKAAETKREKGYIDVIWVSTYYSYHTYYNTTTRLTTACTLTTASTLTSLGSDHDMGVVRDNIRCFTSVSHQRIGEERRYHSKLAWLLGICR